MASMANNAAGIMGTGLGQSHSKHLHDGRLAIYEDDITSLDALLAQNAGQSLDLREQLPVSVCFLGACNWAVPKDRVPVPVAIVDVPIDTIECRRYLLCVGHKVSPRAESRGVRLNVYFVLETDVGPLGSAYTAGEPGPVGVLYAALQHLGPFPDCSFRLPVPVEAVGLRVPEALRILNGTPVDLVLQVEVVHACSSMDVKGSRDTPGPGYIN
jgi:hypothetical protein